MKIKTIRVALKENSYPIYIGRNTLVHIDKELKKRGAQKVFLITDYNIYNSKIYRNYVKQIEEKLRKKGITVGHYRIPPGDNAGKNLDVMKRIHEELVFFHAHRDTWIIALGGGVVGDTAGFAAATYMRGIPYVQVPTTLLAQVDASIGGKTGINLRAPFLITEKGEEPYTDILPAGKNLVGAFYQPKFVFIDIATLKTLPLRELKPGLAEVVKYGVIDAIRVKGVPFFSYLEKHKNQLVNAKTNLDIWQTIIVTSCQIKAKIVSQDEKEHGIRAHLNFGHTVGHAIEALLDYSIYHGEAISIGMVAESFMAKLLRMIPEQEYQRIVSLIKNVKLPSTLADLNNMRTKRITLSAMLEKFYLDKKVKRGKIRFVLPTKIGKVTIREDIPLAVIKLALQEIGCAK